MGGRRQAQAHARLVLRNDDDGDGDGDGDCGDNTGLVLANAAVEQQTI